MPSLKRDIRLCAPARLSVSSLRIFFKRRKAETNATALALYSPWNNLDPKTFERQYKDHLSEFHQWDQKDHADEWLVFEENIGTHLTWMRRHFQTAELYTVLTNKAR